jgi:L-2,4-diaminobutyrate decarboxylase
MNLIEQAYSPSNFRQQAHQLVDVMADYLQSVQNQDEQTVIPFINPEESLNYWQNDLANGIDENPINLFKNIINHSTRLHHPRYMGHQVGVVTPLSAMSSMLTAMLNNGMAVYEMGLVSNPLERIVTDLMAKRIGFDEKSNGLLTSGGTLANLTALLAARAKLTDVWTAGNAEKLAVMVSEEAHYCIDRSARIMGMGSEGIIKVPTNEAFEMKTELLEKYYQEATEKGLKVIAIIGSACSTSTGSYDDLLEIGRFAQSKGLWFHVDGAHGGAVVFSKKYKSLVSGIEMADSVVIDWHKMLLTPALATALIFRNGNDAYETFHQKAQYLWANQTSQDWFNSGKRTFECTKYMMSVKIYSMLKTYGEEIFAEYIDYTHDLAKRFAQMIQERPNFELALEPNSNIVCFRLSETPPYRGGAGGGAKEGLNSKIRQRLLEEGKFYIVQTMLRDTFYLRVSLMNPLTTEQDLKSLLDEIEKISNSLSVN